MFGEPDVQLGLEMAELEHTRTHVPPDQRDRRAGLKHEGLGRLTAAAREEQHGSARQQNSGAANHATDWQTSEDGIRSIRRSGRKAKYAVLPAGFRCRTLGP